MGRSGRREEYLDLRRDGKTHEEACHGIGISVHESTAQRYRRWWETEAGAPDPRRTEH